MKTVKKGRHRIDERKIMRVLKDVVGKQCNAWPVF